MIDPWAEDREMAWHTKFLNMMFSLKKGPTVNFGKMVTITPNSNSPEPRTFRYPLRKETNQGPNPLHCYRTLQHHRRQTKPKENRHQSSY